MPRVDGVLLAKESKDINSIARQHILKALNIAQPPGPVREILEDDLFRPTYK